MKKIILFTIIFQSLYIQTSNNDESHVQSEEQTHTQSSMPKTMSNLLYITLKTIQNQNPMVLPPASLSIQESRRYVILPEPHIFILNTPPTQSNSPITPPAPAQPRSAIRDDVSANFMARGLRRMLNSPTQSAAPAPAQPRSATEDVTTIRQVDLVNVLARFLQFLPSESESESESES